MKKSPVWFHLSSQNESEMLIKGGSQRLSDLIWHFAYYHAMPVFVQTAGWVVFVKKFWQNSKFLQSYKINDDLIMSQNNATNLHFHFKSVKDVP